MEERGWLHEGEEGGAPHALGDVDEDREGWLTGEGGGDGVFDKIEQKLEEAVGVYGMLMGRSPWVHMPEGEGEAPSVASSHRGGRGGGHEEQRSRSISYLSATSSLLSDSSSDDDDELGGLLAGEGEEPPAPVALSTVSQSIFNTVNLLMGTGLLSYPYVLRLVGWIGVPCIIMFALVCNYTGKLIGKLLTDYRPAVKLRDGPASHTIVGFHDLAVVAFGRMGLLFISVLFLGETFGYACVKIIVESGNLHHLLANSATFQGWEMHHFMALSVAIFLPTLYLRNLSLLSYFSAISALSAVMLVVGVFESGLDPAATPNPQFCTGNCTGSVWNPSPTHVANWGTLPAIIGPGMVGYAGHAVFPTIRNDMRDKSKFSTVLNVAFAFICCMYIGIASVGYLMFGDATQDQITLNLGDSFWARLTVWVVCANPITKFALDMSPIALGLEGVALTFLHLENHGMKAQTVSIVSRTLLALASLAVVVAVPSFSLFLGVIGSISSFTVAVTFPAACYLKLFWSEISPAERCLCCGLVALGSGASILGFAAAIQHHKAG